MTDPRLVEIHYRRLPDRLRVYCQRVVLERDDVIVTLSEPIAIESPMVNDGHVMLEEGSLVLWFTFPGVWHDIGLFHRADRTFSGIYANILTPPRVEGATWHTTDLFLDVWWPVAGAIQILDEDEFEEAQKAGHLGRETATRARQEAEDILRLATGGAWPPQIVQEWTLERSLEQLGAT